jgi:glycine cleavage system H lipoate-binding protein
VADFAQQQHGDIVFVELPNVDLTEFMNEDAYRTMVNSDL